MKLNSTIILTSVLFLLMITAGSVSGYFGYVFGYEALKGVGQPDDNPTKKLTGNQYAMEDPNQLILVKERDVIVKIYDHIHKNGGVADDKKPEPEKTEETKPESQPQEVTSDNGDSNLIKNPSLPIQLPIKGQDQNVVLEVIDIEQQGGSLTLQVNLRNESRKTVRFLYSFLDVRDDQGRALSAITEGLPGELPGNGENFSGTVKIPTALLDESEKVSLTLTDYPDQKLQLKIENLPVVR
jgi:hypothetical protein